jgi:Na+-transporting methylmalonyl-CoA/oxaloacetate decarboxylase gamma subunit
MVDSVRAALLISVIGMSLVFGVILLLWGLIALVVRLGADRQAASADGPGEEGGDTGEELDEEEGLGAESLKAAAAAAVAAYLDGDRRAPRS